MTSRSGEAVTMSSCCCFTGATKAGGVSSKMFPLLALLGALCILTTPVLAEVKKDHPKVSCDNATIQAFTLSTADDHVEVNCQGKDWNETLTFNVTVDEKLDSLVVDLMTSHTDAGDKLKISSLDKDGKPADLYESDGVPNGPRFLLTGQKKLQFLVTNGKSGKGGFNFRIKSGCSSIQPFGPDNFMTPLLPNKGSPTGQVKCNITVKDSIVGFDKFTLSATSTVTFIDGVDKAFEGPYNSSRKPDTVFISPKLIMELNIDIAGKDLNVNFTRTPYSGGDVCGKQAMIGLASAQTTIDVAAGKTESVKCLWLLTPSEGAGDKVNFSVESLSLKYASDLLTVIDGGIFSDPPIHQMTALDPRPQGMVMSTGKYLTIMLSSGNFNQPGEAIKLKANAVKGGGSFHHNGTLNFTEDAQTFYLLTANESMSAQVSFGALHLEKEQTIDVYADFNMTSTKIASFSVKNQPFDIGSSTNRLLLVASKFSATGVAQSVKFLSVPQDQACVKTFMGTNQGKMIAPESCLGEIKWIIRPEIKDNNTEMVVSVSLNNAAFAKIYNMSENMGAPAFNLTAGVHPFSFIVKASNGLMVAFGGGKDFQMSYRTLIEPDQTIPAKTGENITLHSPMYPDRYPLCAEHTWKITGQGKVKGYYMAFDLFDLKSAHTLSINREIFTGSTLPPDTFIPEKDVTAVFSSPNTDSRNPQTGYGFSGILTPLECGKAYGKNETTVIESPKNATAETRCVWIVNIPKGSDLNKSIAINFTISVSGKDVNLEHSLKFYDGESALRSPLAVNLTQGKMYQAVSNAVVIVYYNSTTPLNITYTTSECSAAAGNMCLKSRTCMLPSWRCDGVGNCNDGSDEFHCNGTKPYPPTPPDPTPTPGPAPSSGYKVAFWLCMPLFILFGALLTKFGPIIVQRIRDSRYQQFHDLGDH